MRFEDSLAVGHEGDAVGRAIHLLQVFDGLAHALEGDAGVQEVLDHLQRKEGLERIQPLRPRSPRVTDRRSDEARSRPIVELAIADPDDAADVGDAVPLFGHHSSVITRMFATLGVPRVCVNGPGWVSGAERRLKTTRGRADVWIDTTCHKPYGHERSGESSMSHPPKLTRIPLVSIV